MTYSVKEVSEILNISIRAVSKRCKAENIRKKDNAYLIKESHLENWKKSRSKRTQKELDTLKFQELNEKFQRSTEEHNKQLLELQLKNENLITEISDLKKEVKGLKKKEIDNDVFSLILEVNNNEYIKEVLTAIKQGDILERLTEEEHRSFIKRLTEANVLEERIIQYKEEIARMEDYVKDYRNNVEYLKTSLSKQQEQTEILLNSLTQRNYIEAKEKGFDN